MILLTDVMAIKGDGSKMSSIHLPLNCYVIYLKWKDRHYW